MKITQTLLVAAFVSSVALAGNAFADESADQAFSKCRASATEEEVPGTEVTSFIRQCMADAGISQDDINVHTGVGGPASGDGESAPSGESRV